MRHKKKGVKIVAAFLDLIIELGGHNIKTYTILEDNFFLEKNLFFFNYGKIVKFAIITIFHL